MTDVISITFEGEGVKDGRIELSTFIEHMEKLHQAFRRVAGNMWGTPRRGEKGRYPAKVEESSRLALVGLHRGSVVAELEAIQPPEKDLFISPSKVYKAVVKGIERISEREELPDGFDLSTVNSLKELCERLPKTGVEKITITVKDGEHPASSSVTPEMKPKLERLIRKVWEAELCFEGSFYEVNIRSRRAKFQPIAGTSFNCSFEEGKETKVIEGLCSWVRIYGEAEKDADTGKIKLFKVQAVESIPEVAVVKRVKKVDDPIRALIGLGKEIWEGVDPDEYIRELREGWE